MLCILNYTTINDYSTIDVEHFNVRQCLARYRLTVRPSIRPSLMRMNQSKTVKVTIMQFSPYGIPIRLVFAG